MLELREILSARAYAELRSHSATESIILFTSQFLKFPLVSQFRYNVNMDRFGGHSDALDWTA